MRNARPAIGAATRRDSSVLSQDLRIRAGPAPDIRCRVFGDLVGAKAIEVCQGLRKGTERFIGRCSRLGGMRPVG